jgi:hypothetical protein
LKSILDKNRKDCNCEIYIYLIHLKKYFVSNDKSPLTNEPADLFISESNNLQKKINVALENSEKFSLQQIVEIYHQVINVVSMAKILKDNPNVEQNFHLTIQEIEKYVNEKFNNSLHPQIVLHLENSIEETRNDLKNISRENKTKTEIENQAKMFEHLRQIMSTKEFVDQYDKISH